MKGIDTVVVAMSVALAVTLFRDGRSGKYIAIAIISAVVFFFLSTWVLRKAAPQKAVRPTAEDVIQKTPFPEIEDADFHDIEDTLNAK
ncbi:MAG: hypothetical protein RBQ99_02815 [Trichlorobacter sp.]|nr:hypothetical protein [Trichlorobacter sp.]